MVTGGTAGTRPVGEACRVEDTDMVGYNGLGLKQDVPQRCALFTCGSTDLVIPALGFKSFFKRGLCYLPDAIVTCRPGSAVLRRCCQVGALEGMHLGTLRGWGMGRAGLWSLIARRGPSGTGVKQAGAQDEASRSGEGGKASVGRVLTSVE